MSENSETPFLQAQWIGRPGYRLNNWQFPVWPAPMFRREVALPVDVECAQAFVSGLGYTELYINGARIGDHVLDPVVTKYDQRVRFVRYDVTEHFQRGNNAIGVILGNGWYNCHTPDQWHFDKAGWRDYPKLLLEIRMTLANGEQRLIGSDLTWKVSEGAVRFDGLRNGETYDARCERPGWSEPDYDDVDWEGAVVVPGPGGLLQEQTTPPCKVIETLNPVSVQEIRPGVAVYDMGQNMAGWAQLCVSGEPGTEVVMRYGERLSDNGEVDQSQICHFVKEGECQTDRYILKGQEEEIWEPRFTYHGFRYVQVEGLPDTPTLENLRGRVVHTAFEDIGSFACDNEDLNRVQECTKWSFRGNFVGIPTDCPHREKNGWTGDAHFAAEAGLMNFAVGSSYAQWLETMADTQRPSGQFPGIVPSCGWGYNWGNGPAWDSAYVFIPWYIYLYTGDMMPIRQHYEGVKRYLDFCDSMASNAILSFGLGDWMSFDPEQKTPVALTSTAYYYAHTKMAAKFAELLGKRTEQNNYDAFAEEIKNAFNRTFYKGDGLYADGQQTALAIALYQGLVEDTEKGAVVEKLVETVRAEDFKANFGVIGAKYVPRVLAENGHADAAYRLVAQPECPGWVRWIRDGATTLRESWGDVNSRNHIMFGDVSAWMYQYLAGIQPNAEMPGFKHTIIRPHFVSELDWVKSNYASPFGRIYSGWSRNGSHIDVEIELPEGTSGTFVRPDGESVELSAGYTKLQAA